MNAIFLYVKRHKVTGKCYFGKTTKDPLKYSGSGLHWLRHCKQHGFLIETLWFKKFTDQAECTAAALLFSEQNDIVKSDLWLNLKPENGLDGNVKGVKYSAEVRAKMSRPCLEETKAKMSATRKLRSHDYTPRTNQTIETRKKISEARKMMVLTCPHCNKSGGAGMNRWHFSHCKYNITNQIGEVDAKNRTHR